MENFSPKPWPWPISLALAVGGGLAQAFTLPETNWWPLAFFCLIPLYLAARGQTPKRAFFFGWAYGLALGLATFNWLAQVMAGYGGLGAGGSVVLLLLAALLGLYQGLWAYLMAPSLAPGSRAKPYLVPLLGGALWVGLDWLKNFVFTGFNWSPLAMGLASAPRLMGTADLIGLYGLGLPVAAINGWLAYFRPSRLNTYPLLALAGGVLGLALLYGQFTLSRWEEIDGRGEEKTIAVLQASVEQEMKWDANFRDQILGRYQLLFERAQKENPWLVVWSETAAPFSFGYDPVETDWLTGLLARGHSTALVGVTSLEPEDGVWRLYNRIWLMGPAGAGPFYDKRHLVPFGEYVPMERELPFLRWAFLQGILGAAGRFSPGHAYPPIDYDGTRLGIMICFESIFPYLARGRVREGATLLVVATNDAWFGDSWAPEQHLRQSAWRAVENRRPLVRAANNGISAHISPAGRILTRSPHDGIDAYVYRVRLLPEANREMTFFALYGYLLAPLLAIGTVALFSARLYRSKKIRDVSAKFSEFFRGSRANGPR